MLRMVNFWVLMFAVFTGSGCKTEKYKASELPPEQICFGDGGGVAGVMHEYVLLENGQLFFREAVGAELRELKGIRRTKAKKLFDELSEIGFPEITMNAPGNIYHFVEFQDSNTRHRVTWGGSGQPVDPELLELYRKLQAVVSN